MPSFRRRRAALLLPALAVAGIGGATLTAQASTPPEQSASVPAPGSQTTLGWTGTIPAGTNPTSDCTVGPSDTHKITLTGAATRPATATTTAVFSIAWDNEKNDEIIEVDGPGGFTQSGDTASTTESVTVTDPPDGDYTVKACGFGGTVATPAGAVGPTTDQDYRGSLKLTTATKTATSPQPDLPSSDPKGLAFSASVPSDPQRDVSEPLLEIDPAGKAYTCGPTGFSNASDYSNVSTDGGDQFHLLGTQPRGQQGEGGGGDCGLATGVKANEKGQFQYAYAGLGPLTGFTTTTSPDSGRTLYNAGPAGNTNTSKGGGADRQWLTFLNDKDVLLNYNQQEPRNVVVQKSTDGGYSYPPVSASGDNSAIAAGSPDFPGPMRTMPASVVDPNAKAGDRIAYFAWNTSDAKFGYVNLSISDPTGLHWTNCLAHKQPLDQGKLQAFTVSDNDNAGNIYISYGDEGAFHTNLVTLAHGDVAKCDEAVHPATVDADGLPPTKNPGFSAPIQVDRGKVRTTIFPWLVAGGEPGHVAISYYGTESDGDPNPGSFKASWDVYVDQLTNAPIGAADDAKIPGATVGQVKATTHPIHYDSICLVGLSCDTTAPGDRGLGDFFAIDLNPVTKKLQLVYDNTAKLPDAPGGSVAAPMVATQIGGPSNADGAPIVTDDPRAVVRTTAPDPEGDALVDYSFLNPTPPQVGGKSGAQTEIKALDLRDTVIRPEVDPATGAPVKGGGFTVTLSASDLSDGALKAALGSGTSPGSLVYAFRFVNGYQPAAAVAKYDGTAFTFGFDDYTVASQPCFGTTGPKCEIYPGNTPIKGKVDQAKGTITLSVPRSVLTPLKGTTGPGERPTEKALGSAVPGDRFYDATAISFANPSPDPSTQGFMVNADNVRAMDFLLPADAAAAPVAGDQGTTTASTTTSGASTTTQPPASSGTLGASVKRPASPAAKTKAKAKAKKSSARLRIVRASRRNGRLRLTLRTTNGAIRGTTVRVTRSGRTVLRATTKRVGSKGATFTLKAMKGTRLRAGRYRIAVRATGSSKARAGGVLRLR